MEYRSAIVDECGDVVYWCDEMSQDEIQEILDQHPEWNRRGVCIDMGIHDYVRPHYYANDWM